LLGFYGLVGFLRVFCNTLLGVPVFNLQGDYPLDGLTEGGSNENSGAESIITFALGVTCLKEISNKI